MRTMFEKSEEILKELEYNYNGNRRYQAIIFVADTPTSIAIEDIQDFVHNIRKRLLDKGIPCEAIDLFKDFVAKGDLQVGDTGNSFNELVDWLKSRTQPPQRCILIYEIDPLLSTWNDSDIKAFFKKILYHDGIRMPVLLISHMAGRFSLPMEKIGQGLVIRQSDGEA